ncbi:hypothetical protein SLA2020_058040 [Shorea laevis]
MERGGDHSFNRFHRRQQQQHAISGSGNMQSDDTSNTAGAATTANANPVLPRPPCVVREQDQYMPIANVIRIMRRILPPHAKISDDAKETIQECVSEYISFITGEANERCQREQRKTITADDILWAMGKLGFDNYVEPLNLFLTRYRENELDRGSFRLEPIAKRNADYESMMMGPYGPAHVMSQIQFPGLYDASQAMGGGYYGDGSGSGGSSAQNSLINFDPYAQFK